MIVNDRRGTGAFTPKNVPQKQQMASPNGYRLRDTSDRIVRERKAAEEKQAAPAKKRTSSRLTEPEASSTEVPAASNSGASSLNSGKQLGAAINLHGRQHHQSWYRSVELHVLQ